MSAKKKQLSQGSPPEQQRPAACVLGIDPGISGAICALRGEEKIFHVMPETVSQLVAILSSYLSAEPINCQNLICYLEKAQAMPGQGVSAMFKYGAHFGTLCATLEILQIPHVLVRPQEWTREMHKGESRDGTPKERSLAVARRLMPGFSFLATERSYKPHTGYVDAYLLAEYGRRAVTGALIKPERKRSQPHDQPTCV